MVKAKLHITNYNELVTYYSSLNAVKPKDDNNNQNNNRNNKQKWNSYGNNNSWTKACQRQVPHPLSND
eukprot:14714424-Ditylum_brightwellii.AAC.1